jgi:hypothetical protein
MHISELISSIGPNLRRFFLATVARHPGMERFLIRRLTPRIETSLDLIAAAEAQLRSITGTMEARFLESGIALEDLSRSSHSLADNSAELVRLATGRREAEQLIAGTMSMLAEPLSFLHRYTRQLGDHTASLEQGCALLEELLNFEIDLQAAVAPLRATRTMFRVEASRLPEAEQAAFLGLADQIEILHNQVRDSFGAEFATLEKTRCDMSNLVKNLRQQSDRQRKTLERENTRIGDELEKLNRQIDLNSLGEVQLTARGRMVGNAVSRVVMALQSQDFVAQRTQHLFEGIVRIQTLGRGLKDGLSGGRPSDLADLSALVEIQGRQAASALSHLTDTAEATAAATAEIFATVDAMDDECVFLKEFNKVTAAANGTIQVLLDIVEEIRTMVASSVRVGMDSLDQILPVNSLTAQLGDCVEKLSHQMNLVALNAQLQAVRTGAGTGLEVLASHTAGVARETSRLGEAIRESFGRLQDFLKIEVASLTELCDSGRVNQAHLEGAGRDHEKSLHATRDEILGRLNQIAEDALAVRRGAERVAGASKLDDGEAESFETMQRALSDMMAGLSDALSVLSLEGSSLRMEDAGYTMAAEREHHLIVVGGGSPGMEAASGASEQSQVELF